MELTDAVHHLVILGDDMREVVFRLLFLGRTHIGGIGIIGQSASFAQLLEDDTVHATAIVLVEHILYATLSKVQRTLFVMVHAHIDILGIVRSYPNLVLWRRLLGEGRALRNGS